MALQTKTFTWGSYTSGSESNAYVLELTLTENSTSTANNTSSITYALVLKSGGQNRFQGDVKSTLKLNGVTVATKTENKYLDYNSTWTLLSGTTNVTHGSDGSLNMPIVVSIDTSETQYSPPDKTLNWSWTLTKINRYTACTAPTSFTASPEIFNDKVALAWSGASGGLNNDIGGYQIFRADSVDGVNWSDWEQVVLVAWPPYTIDTTDIKHGHYQKYRIRTRGTAGSTYYSGWKESNTIQKVNPSVHIHNGTAYESYAVYIHDGTQFARYAPYIHNGTSWELYV